MSMLKGTSPREGGRAHLALIRDRGARPPDLVRLLPPGAVGMDAIGELAAALKAHLTAGTISTQAAEAMLVESYMAATPALCRLVRVAARGLDASSAEDVVQEVATRLSRIFALWEGRGRFSSYLHTTLKRDALRALGRTDEPWTDERAEAAVFDEVEGPTLELCASVRVRALRRFAWFCFGSPDNSRRLQYDKAAIDFLALSARLEARPFQDLVHWNQPRMGQWGEGAGEPDRKWWRGRAMMGQQRLRDALQDPTLAPWFERLLRELGGGL